MSSTKEEMDKVIRELEKRGVNVNSHMMQDTKGLGDVVEEVLTKFGITQDRFKKWFGLKECNCTKRKKWLNGLFNWKVTKDE
tara:strand:- start:110 stop:355 length:246 start_codon:yes stop_codon:yes gene_type:complete